jgi:hypothetical protein
MTYDRDALSMRAGGAYCPHCRSATTIDSHGRCMNIACDQVVLGGTLREPEAERHVGRSRGPDRVSMKVLREAYDAYLTGLSIRRVAIAFLDQTTYSSVQSCANCLCDAWRGMGWPLRDRVAATRATSYRHGLARDPDHRRRLRRASGEIRDVQCAAIKTRYGKGRGERCQRPAMLDGAYCHNHEPALRDQVHEHLARVRAVRSSA